MKNYLLVDSFLGKEFYFDSVDEFESYLFARLCGMAKIVRVLHDDSRALFVYEICDVSEKYTL